MFRTTPLLTTTASVFLVAVAPALAGDVVLEATGTLITANAGAGSPFAGASVGDPVLLHFEVFVPGTDVAPGQFTNYAIDPATSFIQIGTASDALTGGMLGIQNDFPVADGVRVFGSPAASGGSVQFEVGEPTGTMFSSTDITQEFGTWGPNGWSSYSFMLAGGGNFLEVSLPTITIGAPEVGTNYCGPAVANSSGVPGSISGIGSQAVADNDLRLRADGLPLNSFGFFLNSRDAGFTANPGGSQGNLCLGGSVGRFDAQVQNSGAAGAFEIPVDLTAIPQPTGTVAAMAGETWRFQAWFRDANPTLTSNFTNGLEVTFN